jgi:hypothetical protein
MVESFPYYTHDFVTYEPLQPETIARHIDPREPPAEVARG